MIFYDLAFFFLSGSLGKSFRKRTRWLVTLLPAIMRVTARMIRMIPQHNRNVNDSPKTVTPKNTAVNGSKAPRIAVGGGADILDRQCRAKERDSGWEYG